MQAPFLCKLFASSYKIQYRYFMELFDYVKLIFSNDEKWKDVTSVEKRKNFWMLSRFMSIKHPVQASVLSHFKIDPEAVSDYWHRSMSSLYTGTPGWVYAKTKKKDDTNKKFELPSPEMIKWYCGRNEMSRREFDENIKFFGDDFLKEIRSLEKVLKSQNALD